MKDTMARKNEIERIRSQIIAHTHMIPPMPATLVKMGNLLSDPKTSLEEIVSAIQYDPGFTANVLKMANSAFMGFSRQVGSLKEALIRIGTQKVFQIAVANTVHPIMGKALEGYNLESGDFWRHSIAVAVTAQNIAHQRPQAGGDGFTAGLLHDIGKLVLSLFMHSESASFKTFNEFELPFDAAEKAFFGIDHAQVGADILGKWNFPEAFEKSVEFHHNPPEDGSAGELADIIHIADALCLSGGLGTGSDGLQYHLCPVSVKRLGLDHDAIERILCQTLEKMKKFEELIEISQN